MPDNTPPSSSTSPPTSPHQIPQPILTPLTFQLHPSTIQSYPSFGLNTTSPNYYPTQIPSTYPLGIIQQGSFGSSFNSITSLPRPASQPVELTMTRSKNPKKPDARGGKSQSSTSRKSRATTRKPPQSPSSGKQQKKGKKNEKRVEDGPCRRKPPVKWEDQKNEKGESAISILLNWITTYENWTRYKSHTNYKSTTLESITSYLVENGIHDRNEKIVASKISNLESQFNDAQRWIDQSGQGAMNHLEAEKQKSGWEDEDPAYVAKKKVLVDSYIEARCKYYWQLEPVMGQRDKATRLASGNSAHPDNPDDSLECLGLTEIETQSQNDVDVDHSQRSLPDFRNDDEHSEASNEEYHRLHTQEENHHNSHDVSNEDMRCLIYDDMPEDVASPTDSIAKNSVNQTPKSLINPSRKGFVPKSATKLSVTKINKRKASGESQVKELLNQNADTVKSSITEVEDSLIQSSLKSDSLGDAIKDLATILKPKDDPRSLLSKEDQLKQAKLDAELHSLKVESAQLDVKRTKQAMDMDYRIARGKFIAQVMADNHLTLEQAKEVAAEVFPSIDSDKTQS